MKSNRKRQLCRAIVSSSLVIVLSLASLVGGTFAWFTDSEKSDTNRIIAGNLDVELYYKNAETGATLKDVAGMGADPLFFVDKDGEDILWRPGAVSVCDFEVRNVGSIALKYRFDTVATDGNDADSEKKLSSVIKAAVLPSAPANREAAIAAGNAAGWSDLSSLIEDGALASGESKGFSVVLYWQPTENDNDFNMKNENLGKKIWIDVDIRLVAVQYSEDYDPFGNN